jgi:GNAT superfamily N-acetyltransferase
VDKPAFEYVIRPAQQDDAQEIARLLTLLGHATTAAEVQARWPQWSALGNECLVAQRADGSLGGIVTLHTMLVLHRPLPVGRITALVVDTHLRGSGVGRALVAQAEARLTTQGCGLLELTSNMQLKPAHAFYQHIGYEQTSHRFAKTLSDAGM